MPSSTLRPFIMKKKAKSLSRTPRPLIEIGNTSVR
jgi:hypothetical protein